MNLGAIFSILHELEKTTSGNQKLSILNREKDNNDLKEYFRWSLDSRILFYNTAPVPTKTGAAFSIQEEVLKLFTTRKITGNEAKEGLLNIVNMLDSNSQLAFCRLINKDPKCGVQSSTVNKVWPNLVTDFDIMKGDSIDDLDPSLVIGREAQAKMDGRRVLIMKEGNSVSFLSSNGKPVYNLEEAIPEVLSIPLEFAVIDCEIYDESWNGSTSISQSSVTKKTNDTWRLYYWDILTIDEWRLSVKNPYISRKEKVFSMLTPGKRLVPVHSYGIIKSVDHFKELCEQSIQEGYEGLMMKDMNYVWRPERTLEWIKYKPTITRELKIIEILPGDAGKRNQNTLGRLVLQDKDGTEFKCGNGFSDSERQFFWENQGTLIGSFVEVVEDRVPDRKKMITRFPRFVKRRPDKDKW
jgi:DNA ligase-1